MSRKFKEVIKVNEFYELVFESFDDLPDDVHVSIECKDGSSTSVKVSKKALTETVKNVLGDMLKWKY